MSDHNDHMNGHDRVPDKRPEIGQNDLENLLDFDNTDDEDNLVVDAEDSEELSEMQVVDGAAQLLEQDDIDEIQEVPGDLPDILYEFDPIQEVAGDSSSEEVLEISGAAPQVLTELGPGNEVAEASSSEEILEISGDMPVVVQEFDPGNEVAGASSGSNDQNAVEQQIVDLTGVPIEMVEERSDNQLNAEEQPELARSDTVKESSPRKSISDEYLNPGCEGEAEGNDSNGKSSRHSSTEDNFSRVSLEHHANDQNANLESSVSEENNQIRNGISGCHQGSNFLDVDQSGVPSASGQFDGAVNTRKQGISCDMLEAEINLQGESSESNHSTRNESLNIGQSGSGECIEESLNSAGNSSVQSATQSDAGSVSEQDYGLRYHAEESSQPVAQEFEHLNGGPGSGPDPGEQQENLGHLTADEEAEVAEPEAPLDHGLRDRAEESCQPVAQEFEHLNGGPGSGPDPGEQQENLGHLTADEEAEVAEPEAPLEPNGNNPDRIESLIVPDEQDNLLEEQVEEVHIAAVLGPLEPEQRPNVEVVVEENADAEAQK